MHVKSVHRLFRDVYLKENQTKEIIALHKKLKSEKSSSVGQM